MKKHVLLMIMVLMSLNVVAQEMEEFDRMSAFPVTNVVSGTKKKCMYTRRICNQLLLNSL